MFPTEENKQPNDIVITIHYNLGKADKFGRCEIKLIAYIGKVRVVISVGEKIEPSLWRKRDYTTRRKIDEKAIITSECGITKRQQCDGINRKIDTINSWCEDYADKINSSTDNEAIEHTAENFKAFIVSRLNGAKGDNSPKTFISSFIDRKAVTVDKHTQRIPSRGTIYNHRTALKRLEQFCKDTEKTLTWRLFNNEFESAFHTWGISKKNPYSKQTVCSTLASIKCWLNAAEKKNVKVSGIFHEWKTKCKSDKEDEGVYLKDEELERIKAIDFNDPTIRQQLARNIDFKKLEQTRDLFIIAANTSLRFSDWSENLPNAKIIEGDVLKVFNNKTHKFVYCPYTDEIKSIVEKYGGFNKLPTPPSLSTAESYIKRCAWLAGLNNHKDFSTKTARRSFVTNHIAKGCRMDAVAAATGHTTSTLVQLYNKSSVLDRARSLVS